MSRYVFTAHWYLVFILTGNHGEDVKECYYYLDSTPTHSYMKALYKYPQNEYPYAKLVTENKQRTIEDREFELADTGKRHNISFYHIGTSVLLENTPLVKFIRNYIRDSSGVFSISILVRILMTSFPAFSRLFVQTFSKTLVSI